MKQLQSYDTTLVLFLSLLFVTIGCSPPTELPEIVVDPSLDQFEFEEVDNELAHFVLENWLSIDGASIVIVEKDSGVIHKAAIGSHQLDSVLMLASVSKVPSVSILMSLASDASIDINLPISSYLPASWEAAYPGITTSQLLSSTSGIPGLGILERDLVAYAHAGHMCQFEYGYFGLPTPLQSCAKSIYENVVETPVRPPGEIFDYGGSQWQLAGGVAEVVSGQSWGQLVEQRLAIPCGLEVFRYGNIVARPNRWNGNPDDLLGSENPSIEGGAISNVDDYAKMLMMHLNDGWCENTDGELTQVLTPELVEEMRVDRGTDAGSRAISGWGYGMGWWVIPPLPPIIEPNIYVDPGAFGSVAWLDSQRQYAVFVALEKYNHLIGDPVLANTVFNRMIRIVESTIDKRP